MNIRATSFAATVVIIGLLLAIGIFIIEDRRTGTDMRALVDAVTALHKDVRAMREESGARIQPVQPKSAVTIAFSQQPPVLADVVCPGDGPCAPDELAVRFCESINYKSGRSIESEQQEQTTMLRRIVCFD